MYGDRGCLQMRTEKRVCSGSEGGGSAWAICEKNPCFCLLLCIGNWAIQPSRGLSLSTDRPRSSPTCSGKSNGWKCELSFSKRNKRGGSTCPNSTVQATKNRNWEKMTRICRFFG